MVRYTAMPLYTPIVWEARWAPGLVWQVWNISPLPGFDPWTIQSVASHYTDYAIPAHKSQNI
jgi:hypothetical protein